MTSYGILLLYALIDIAVRLDVVKDTRAIQFHVLKLKLGRVKLTSSSLNEPITQDASELQINESDERATLTLPVVLPAGTKADLTIDFESELTGSMTGYYRSAWEKEGKTAYYALTHFEVGITPRLLLR